MLEQVFKHTINMLCQTMPQEAVQALDAGSFARLAYLPRHAPGAPAPTIYPMQGSRLSVDVDNIPARTTLPTGPVEVQPLEDTAHLASALEYLDANEREEWIEVGHALKNSHGDDAYDVWKQWSLTALDPDTEDDLWTRWETFGPRSINPIKVDTIYYRARERGWIAPDNDRAPMVNPFEGQERTTLQQARAELKDIFAKHGGKDDNF